MARATLTSLGPCDPMRRRYKLEIAPAAHGSAGFPLISNPFIQSGRSKNGSQAGRNASEGHARRRTRPPLQHQCLQRSSAVRTDRIVSALLPASRNQPHQRPRLPPVLPSRSVNARYALHNRIDNRHPALSLCHGCDNPIPAWPSKPSPFAAAYAALIASPTCAVAKNCVTK